MQISARVHYATLALLELAVRSQSADLVPASQIIDRHGIPGPFLTQILRSLRAAGWVQSIRGSQGGYRLSVPPDQISLLDIAEALGCQETLSPLEAKTTPASELLQSIWDQAAEASRQVLAESKLSDLAERASHGEATMFYI